MTVEDDGNLDLADFDVEKHVGVLLDGVSDALILKKHRETLQGRPKVLKGAKSATMKHAYPFTLCRKAVIATMDTAADNLELLSTDPWLSDPRNILQLELISPAWVGVPGGSAGVAAQVQLSAKEKMEAWRAADVQRFLGAADLAGPATTIFANGVNGCDLATMNVETLTKEVRVSAFAARKVIARRDAFLAA